MKKTILALALAASPLLVPATASAEVYYPWCATYNGRGGGGTNCGFVNRGQCMASISGVGGACYRNPDYPEQRSRRYR